MDLQRSTERIQECLEKISLFTATPGEGTTRLPFSKEARQTAEYLKTTMGHIGLETREDAAGNIIGRLAGRNPSDPVVIIASHFDSVKFGGGFDGIAGVAVGVEVVRLLRDRGLILRHPLEVIATNDEEGVRYGGGYFGTKAMLGEISAEYLQTNRDADGMTVGEAMRAYGLDPDRIGEARREAAHVAAFIEAHIEQGPVLDTGGWDIGLVEDIVGIKRFMVTVTGRADHAGATPMPMRLDALAGAARVVCALREWAAAEGEGTVATVGFMRVEPGAVNVVPREACFSVDIRSRSPETLEGLTGRLEAELRLINTTGLRCQSEKKLDVQPAAMNRALMAQLAQSCDDLGFSSLRLSSGAGHDALQVAPHMPAAMLFVPSRGGRSHCPEEWTDYVHLARAAHVLCDTVQKLF
ncbi:MAG: M20 family metallo-hydrolase [Gracilibacteraceae bacterium]|nr:M20 family metallo-hydrolase [Gracilibacteraceae bacterium]